MGVELYDVTIVGGGPAGMYSAFYSGMRDMKTKIIEYREELGGRLLMYPEKMIWDVGGVAPILGKDLINVMKRQAETFEPTIVLGQQIVDIERHSLGYFVLTTADDKKHYSKTVILALGYGVLTVQKLTVDGAERFENKSLHYTVQKVSDFAEKHVLISGGGDAAVDWANTLLPVAKQVIVVHRRHEFGGHEKNVRTLRESSAQLYTPYEIEKLFGEKNRVEEVIIRNSETGEKERLAVDEVIVNHGLRCNFGALANCGIRMQDNLALVDHCCATNIPGIYGVGDYVNHGSKVRLIAGAFTDAALAVNNAKLLIEPDAPEVAYVSSHNIRFKERNKQLGLYDDNYRDVRG